MPRPRGVDVPDGPKGSLNAACHLLEEDVEAGHLLLVDDNAAPREEGVPVAVHQHALHDRLRQVAGPGAGAAHLPHGTPPRLASLGGGTAGAPAASRLTLRGVASVRVQVFHHSLHNQSALAARAQHLLQAAGGIKV